jgi:hypothetical protein
MTDNEVQVGLHYTYKGNEYIVLKCDEVEVKDPDDGNWYPAVVYHKVSTEDDTNRYNWYIRRLEDFQAKFKAV